MNLRDYFKKERFAIFREALISVVVSALVLTLFTYYSNAVIDKKIASRQFIFDFGRTFIDNPKYRQVSVGLEEQYFYGKPFLKSDGKQFNDYELDDYLYLLSDVWTFYKEGFISKELVDDQYFYFFCVTYNSKSINEYRAKLRKEGFLNDHSYLDEINSELNLKSKNCKNY